MPITSVTEMFENGATISSFNLTIPSGSLISCPLPSSGDPNEVIFGLVETVFRAVASGSPTNITASASTTLTNSTTLRRSYNFSIDLGFDGADVIETLNVKPS
jgi:hypothetical protein